MLTAGHPLELSGFGYPDVELSGLARRPRPALHVKLDNHRVVERRATELRRLQRQFNGVVTRTSRFQDDCLEAWRNESYVPALQRWCPRLERDVHAVCCEAGLSAAATASVVGACRSGTIPQNPGVLLSRLMRFQDCLAQPLGRRDVLSLLRSAPSLLRYSPESLRWNVDMLGTLLPDAAAVAAAVRRAPMLLGASAITLWGNFEGLRRLLRLHHDAAIRLVLRAPRLLLNSRGALEGRMEALSLLSGGAPRRAVAAAVARQPALLGYFPGTLERNLRTAAALLAVPFSRVQPLLLKQPAFAMLASESLRGRISSLRDAAGLHDAADLAAVVLRQPSLLTLSPETVRLKVAVVERVLELQGRPDELRAVLRGAPQLLTLAADSIEAKARALRAAVAPHHPLRSQLQLAPPQTVAMWLCMSARRYDHVRVVAAAAAAAVETSGPWADEPTDGSKDSRADDVTLPRGIATANPKDVPIQAALGTEEFRKGEQQQHKQGNAAAAVAAAVAAAGSFGATVREEPSGGAAAGAPLKRGRGRPRRAPWIGQPDPAKPQPHQQEGGQSGWAGPTGTALGCVAAVAGTDGPILSLSLSGGREAPQPTETRLRLSLYALLRDGGSRDGGPRSSKSSPASGAASAQGGTRSVRRKTVAAAAGGVTTGS